MTDNTPDKDAHYAGLYINGNMPDPGYNVAGVIGALFVIAMVLVGAWAALWALSRIIGNFADWFTVCANCGM